MEDTNKIIIRCSSPMVYLELLKQGKLSIKKYTPKEEVTEPSFRSILEQKIEESKSTEFHRLGGRGK